MPEPLRVLLVDDVPEIRLLVSTAIRLRGGFQVVGEAGDGATAVELASQTRPDVVVLDLGLPDLRDRELLAAVRRAAPDAKVAVFTGLTDDDGVRTLVEGYVPKDQDVAALLDLLEDLGGPDQQVAVLALPHVADSARLGREYLRHHADRWAWPGDLYEAEMVVAELVANALAHGTPPYALRLSHSAGSLAVEVSDASPEPPAAPDGGATRDWTGMAYVSLLAQAWGVTPRDDGGKWVWARLVAPDAGRGTG